MRVICEVCENTFEVNNVCQKCENHEKAVAWLSQAMPDIKKQLACGVQAREILLSLMGWQGTTWITLELCDQFIKIAVMELENESK